MVKNPSGSTGDTGVVGSIPGSGRPPGEGNGNPLQYSCLKNPMDRGAWQTIVHGVAKRQTQQATKHSTARGLRELSKATGLLSESLGLDPKLCHLGLVIFSTPTELIFK